MSDKAALHLSLAILALAISYLFTHRYAAVSVGDHLLGTVDTLTGKPCVANGGAWVCPDK